MTTEDAITTEFRYAQRRQEILEAVRPYIKILAEFTTAEQIRVFLWEKGVRGWRSESESCPIATYLQKESSWPVSVGYHSIACMAGGIPLMYSRLGVPTEAMVEFISRFDHGDYPELMARGR